MAPRAYWKGYLKLSLVSCPIALYPASSSSERVSFRQINKQTGNRLKQQLIDAVTGEPVESEDKGRAYEIGKNQFLMVEDEELELIAVESTHTIDIDSFVPRAEIDQRYLDSPYYIAPDDQVGQEAFAVIRDSMRDKGMVGLGRVVLSRRERVVMLEPMDKGVLATTLRYPYEVRDSKDYFDDIPDIKLPAEMKQLAAHILDTKAAHFEPEKFDDRYETAVVEMLKTKQAGMPTKVEKAAPRPANVVNLMDAPQRSIEAEGGRSTRSPARSSARAGEQRAAAAERAKPQKKTRRAG